MCTHVEFRSDKFPAYETDAEQVANPDLWGRRLAEYLSHKLYQAGIRTEKMYVENWGWIIPVMHENLPMWIGCGHYEKYLDGYLVFIKSEKPSVPRVLKQVADAIDRILTADRDIRGIRWWT